MNAKDCCRRWRKNNKERIRIYNKIYKANHPNDKKKKQEYDSARYQKNKDLVRIYGREYRENNKKIVQKHDNTKKLIGLNCATALVSRNVKRGLYKT